nr:26S proteasome non-ATPase regulatory subunit 9 isoform X1 [Tanacetum cinerariifolium]
EISDNDEENCERLTMQAASGATECESKGEHDGKIFDMTVDTSLASPAAPNKIVSIKSIAKIAYDGLQLEDQIVKFRDVEYGDNLLPKLASKAQKNQWHPVLMLVMKQGTSINLAVKPRTWRHRGMLGDAYLSQAAVRCLFPSVHGRMTELCRPTQKTYNLGVIVAMGRFMDDVVDNE